MKYIPEKYHVPFLLLLTTLSRLPFIFNGFGVEEDSWGLVVNAYEMKTVGHYIASRFPGHPLQEYVYRIIYDQPAWVYNFFSLIASVVAVVFFYKALRKMQFNGAFFASLIFCFTPVFYIAGTYTIDFAWTIAFVMMSFYYLLDHKLILSGIFIGMATGCRLTSEVFLLPWALLLWSGLDVKTSVRRILKISIPAGIVGVLWFLPAYLQYGIAFFDYSDQFPYPNIPKVIYKATIGVFGFTGMLALAFFIFPSINNWRKKNLQAVTLFTSERLLTVCILIIGLHLISYLRLPQKSGYMVPAIPFVILFFGLLLTEKQFGKMTIAFIISPFLFSINIADHIRGAETSSFAKSVHIAGQEIFFDPFNGPIFSERSKRINKMNYCDDVMQIANRNDCKEMIICGWWYNELLVPDLMEKTKVAGKYIPRKNLRFYMTCASLDSAKREGVNIFYLLEQNTYNDEMFNQDCTEKFATPFPEK